MRKWSKELIAQEIMRLNDSGCDLCYSTVAANQVALLRAATRYYGSWSDAVTASGIEYDEIKKYRSWSRERVLEGIKHLHARGEDLSWKQVSTVGDRRLAAAATKTKNFGSWRAALEAAGIDYKDFRRYKKWSKETIVAQIQQLSKQGVGLNAKNIEATEMSLITAARRQFTTWDMALRCSGLDPNAISLRKARVKAKLE